MLQSHFILFIFFFVFAGNVILVLMAYRLGALGFLSTGDYNSPGNFGLKDQVMAMKWVKEYIREFGGDSNSVTIFGSSAGGASVHMHMMSPLSAGIYADCVVFFRKFILVLCVIKSRTAAFFFLFLAISKQDYSTVLLLWVVWARARSIIRRRNRWLWHVNKQAWWESRKHAIWPALSWWRACERSTFTRWLTAAMGYMYVLDFIWKVQSDVYNICWFLFCSFYSVLVHRSNDRVSHGGWGRRRWRVFEQTSVDYLEGW